jgi:hypothetical protein
MVFAVLIFCMEETKLCRYVEIPMESMFVCQSTMFNHQAAAANRVRPGEHLASISCKEGEPL